MAVTAAIMTMSATARDSANASMLARTDQANNSRLIYSLSTCRPKALHCKLLNGFYFVKMSRTDERFRFTEKDILAITRTILFMYVFEATPKDSMLQLINCGEMTPIMDSDMRRVPKELCVITARRVLDSLFGKNFSVIARKPVRSVLTEYMRAWRYYNAGLPVKLPSVRDFIKIHRFVNVVSPSYSAPTMLVNLNTNDHKIPLQGATKLLK